MTAVGCALAAWYGYRQLDGMSGDVSGFTLTVGELWGVLTLAVLEVSMELIIGGAFQGKLEYAMERYGLTDADVCDLALGAPVPGKRCYRHLEALSRREDVTPYLPLFPGRGGHHP